jgi:hypothetical protein
MYRNCPARNRWNNATGAREEVGITLILKVSAHCRHPEG